MADPAERIYDKHAQALFSLLLSLLRIETNTRDVSQAVFCKLLEWPDLLDGVRDKRAFLLPLAHNLSVDLMRRRSTRDKKKKNLRESN